MDLILPDWPDAPANIGAFSTSRRGGFSRSPYDDGNGGGGLNLGLHVGDAPEHVGQNRRLLQSLLPARPVWLNQVHGATVVDAAAAADTPNADASVTNQRGVVCAIQTADCLPVLFCDAAGNVVGAAHAGWRGLANGVLQNTVQAMRNMGAIDILAWLGPAIGPEQFEVGEDVLQAFSAHGPETETAFKPRNDSTGKYLADIYQLARIVLAKYGVAKIHGGNNCTVSDAGRFYSYRRDRITGRMASLIWIR
jgi:polyphenol oxidase